MTAMMPLLPELYLVIAALALLVYRVYRGQKTDGSLIAMALFVLTVTAALAGYFYAGKSISLNGMFVTDAFSLMAKLMILAASALVLLLSTGWLKEEGGKPFEFVILMLLSTLGMMLMVSAADFLSLYMALEMSSLGLYVLASFNRDNARSSEAGLKYFVLGALASGMMLFGISLVYGFAGSTNFAALTELFLHTPITIGTASAGLAVSKAVIVGMVLVAIGFCFKISAVPFHMWTPDVYEGAPTPVTAFFATAPKIAALALFARVMTQPFGPLFFEWQQVIIFVSLTSMIVGALAAIMQTNIKRLLAYSSIGHVGFMLMALAAGAAGVQALLIYLALYIFMSAGAFGCVLLMRRGGQYVEEIKDLAGLGQSKPALAIALSIFMFSMAGIPPLAGFFGKFYAVLAAINAGLTWLAVVGVVASVIGGFYYIKVVKVMYFDEPAQPFDANIPRSLRFGIILCAGITLLFFLWPTPLILQAKIAAEALLP